jgi:hypothetical protein
MGFDAARPPDQVMALSKCGVFCHSMLEATFKRLSA